MPRINVTRMWQLLPLKTGTIDNIGIVPVEISTDRKSVV